MTDYKYVTKRRQGAAVVATTHNPPGNLLNAPMVAELTGLVSEIERDEDVRALILTGGAEGIFITHYDVGELAGASDVARGREGFGGGESRGLKARATIRSGPRGLKARATERSRTDSPPPELHGMHKLLLALQALPQPVIAAINGTAMGGGCELALACDFRVMARGYQIGLPEVRVGILPGAGGTQRMTRLIGVAKAMELMLLGNTVDAETAERIGLVHRCVDGRELMAEALALASELASRPRLSVALIKQCIVQGSEMPLIDALRFEQDAFWRTMRSEDAARLMRAYLSSGRPLDEV